MKKIACIGHITLDRIITPAIQTSIPGGTAYYFAKALSKMPNLNLETITAVGESEINVIESLRAEGLKITLLPSKNSVIFENKYNLNMNQRTQRVLAKADHFKLNALENIDADFFHLGTLLADDFDPEVIKHLAAKGTVSIDVQGYLRKVDGEKVLQTDWKQKKEILPYVSILKANEDEMTAITGETDPQKAAIMLQKWGCKEIILTLGDKGSIIYDGNRFYNIPAFPPTQLVDPTGCGDTYMAGYLYKRASGASHTEAGTFAAALCTLKLAAPGPFSGTIADILPLLP